MFIGLMSDEVDESWPIGPATLPLLFDWPSYNADRLFEDATLKASFSELSHRNIYIFEAYAGTGNASVSAAQQFWSLCQAARTFLII